jgi:hypothetical protein
LTVLFLLAILTVAKGRKYSSDSGPVVAMPVSK